MTYSLTNALVLGSGLAGITSDLRGQLVDTAGTNVGSAITTGFTEIGAGNYIHNYASYPDGHQGGITYYRQSTGAVLAFVAINPQEVEYTDTKTSTRMATFTYTAPDNATITAIAGYVDTEVAAILAAVDTEVAAIKAKTDNLPTDPADASDIAASFAAITSTLSTIASYIDTEVAAIKAKTDNLPADPADASDIAASFSTVSSTLTTIAGYIDTEVAAIKAKTDLIPASPAAAGDIPTALAISDAVWDELMPGHVIATSAGAYLAASGAASDPLLNTVPGSYASGTAGAALGRIGSGQIVTTSPVAPDGDVTIWAGYDMLAADGYSLDWTDTSNVWPVLTGATVSMICRGPSTMTFAGSVVTATGSSKKVRVELQDTQTVDMPISNHWVYDVAATLTGGDIVPLVKGGRLYVKAKPG